MNIKQPFEKVYEEYYDQNIQLCVFPDRADLRVPRRSDDGAGGYPDDPDHRAPWRRRKAT